jgi:PadR family transcriptional regulator, regulatory protein PadR
MADAALDQQQLKKGSAELLILATLEDRARHGYDIGRQIALRSKGTVRFHAASLYPLLYRLARKGWIHGRWLEKEGQRRRRYYRLTPAGQKALEAQRRSWQEFAAAMERVTQVRNA